MHYLSKLTLFVIAFCTISSCVSLNFEIQNLNEGKTITSPEVGEISVGRLGDTLVSKAFAIFGQAYQIQKDARIGKARTKELNNKIFGIPAEEFLYDQTRDDFVTTKWPDEGLLCAGTFQLIVGFAENVCKEIETGKFVLATFNPYELLYVRDIEDGKVKEIEKVVVGPSNFKQELIYNGRVGNGLKFIYREFTENLVRPSFTQSVQYDLSKSNVIGFKTLEIEIIDATNTDISYKVINHF